VFPATLFDYNGVLVDDENVHLEAFRDVLGPLGIDLEEADYWEKYLGFDDAGAFRAVLVDAGRTPEGPGLPPPGPPDVPKLQQVASLYGAEIVGPPLAASGQEG
jgi:beta-phosphoglucomutase-like phosphatase (HAD superfamily)